MADNGQYGDPGNTREGEPTATLGFPSGLVQLGGDRTQQPGQLVGQLASRPPVIERESLPAGWYMADQASDKFAIYNHLVGNDQPYQLLPVEPARKRALIRIPQMLFGFPLPQIVYQAPVGPAGTGGMQNLGYTPGNPAAGANFSTGISAGQGLVVAFTFTTSAVAGNRLVGLTITAGITTTTYYAMVPQPPSVTWSYVFANGVLSTTGTPPALTGATSAQIMVAIGPGPYQTATIASVINNIQAGDQISAININLQAGSTSPTSQPKAASVFVGDLTSIDAANAVAQIQQPPNPMPPAGVFPIYQGDAPFLYTSKAALYASAFGAGTKIWVSTMVERFASGTPVA